MRCIVPVNQPEAILSIYRDTPSEELLRFHNLGAPLPTTTGHARLLISMCMDHRKDLLLPNEFAYVLRSAGGNLRDSEFEVSYAIAVGGVATVALLAHTDCGMAESPGSGPSSSRDWPNAAAEMWTLQQRTLIAMQRAIRLVTLSGLCAKRQCG